MAKKLQPVDFSDSYISIILGFLVVLVGGILLYNFFTKTKATVSLPTQLPTSAPSKVQTPSTQIPTAVPQKGTAPAKLPAEYTVAAEDTLWSIAQKFYSSGYNWVDIANENKITNPQLIFSGTKLRIPNVEIREPNNTASINNASKGELLPTAVATPKTYTVKKGDTLWGIAVKVYADGFAWPKIAQANHLANPRLIHPGNKFIIP